MPTQAAGASIAVLPADPSLCDTGSGGPGNGSGSGRSGTRPPTLLCGLAEPRGLGPAASRWSGDHSPKIQGARGTGRAVAFVHETGHTFRARLGPTWARRGHPPVLRRLRQRREVSSIAAVVAPLAGAGDQA